MEWHDDPLPKFFKELIGDLRDEVWRLNGSGNGAGNEKDAATDLLICSLEDEVKKKQSEMDAMKYKYKTMLGVGFLFLLGLVLGKLVVQ